MKLLFDFLRYVTKGHRRRIAGIILLSAVEVLCSLVFVYISKVIIDIATDQREGTWQWYALWLILLIIGQIAFRTMAIWLVNITEIHLANGIRYRIFSHLLYMRWTNLRELHSGDIITRIINDTEDVTYILVSALPIAVASGIQLLGALIMLFILDPMLALILGLGTPLVILFSKLYYRKMRRYTMEMKQNESQITIQMEETLQNQLVVRTFEKQTHFLGQLGQLQHQLQNRVKERTTVSLYANTMMQIAFQGGYVAAFLWSVVSLANKTITFGTVAAYLQLVVRIQRPISDLIRLLPTVIAARTSVERLRELTAFETELVRNKVFLKKNVSLHVKNITFAYEESTPNVLSDFSFEAKPGEMIAIVGETGAGKTTLIRLLLALIKPSKGSIELSDGEQTVEVMERTRSNFVYVPQGGSLFSGTIRDNLLIGKPDAKDTDLERVLRIASASFVFDLPNGLDTQLSEKGGGLSEGQAQRISIARSLLRPGKILLLDEATSALDTETEKMFLHNLKKEMGDRIVLFVTHHPEVMKFCDKSVRI